VPGDLLRAYTQVELEGLAASNPEMWVDILLLNRSAVVEALEQTRARLQELQQLLSDAERDALLQFCEIARGFRLGIDR